MCSVVTRVGVERANNKTCWTVRAVGQPDLFQDGPHLSVLMGKDVSEPRDHRVRLLSSSTLVFLLL
jgi:hypothetical protein